MGFWLLLQQIPVEDSGTNIDLASLEDTSMSRTAPTRTIRRRPKKRTSRMTARTSRAVPVRPWRSTKARWARRTRTAPRASTRCRRTRGPAARAPAGDRAGAERRYPRFDRTRQGGAFASLTGTGDISSGFDDSNIYGGLLGNEAGEMNGGFGFGRSGFGPGRRWHGLGHDRYRPLRHDRSRLGTGSGYGVGGGRGGMRGRSAAVPTVSIGQPNAQGDPR
jgi:hypothetical protein